MQQTSITTSAAREAGQTEACSILDGTPFMVCEKGGSRCLFLHKDHAELAVVPAHFCGPIFVSRESGERKMIELAKRLPGFQFELITRETLSVVREISGKTYAFRN